MKTWIPSSLGGIIYLMEEVIQRRKPFTEIRYRYAIICSGIIIMYFWFQVCPSANYYECKAMAIGARSQSARTYLEKHLDEFDCDLEPLVAHGLRALRDTLPNEVDLSNKVSTSSLNRKILF